VASIEELKQRIDLHDLADKLGLSRPGGRGNYRSPHHEDKSPSLSIFERGGQWRWKDHSQDVGGSCVDLVCYVKDMDVAEAVVYLHELYGLPLDKPKNNQPIQPKTLAEHIADKCFQDVEPAIEYLTGRGIGEDVAKAAIKRRAVGWNVWTSNKIEPGNPGHGGPACAFIVRTVNPGRVVAVDMRYKDVELNGGVKTQCQGEKYGYAWYNDLQALKKAHTVYVVESPINALSVETIGMRGVAAVAVRGVNVAPIDWSFLAGKRVLLCFDNDKPDDKGKRPGAVAAWKLHELLLGMNISALMVDQSDWEHNDVNDILCEEGPDTLYSALQKVEPWIIPGMSGSDTLGKPRIYLPPHDFSQYWRYRAKDDFTTWVKSVEKDDDGVERENFTDLAGFRVAGISRVTIASATATMTGEQDAQPNTVFSVSVQTPRHGNKLIRRVFEDEKLHNIDQWRKFGPVFNQSAFSRMVTLLERAASVGARHAANFVGLCWREGKLVVNEGPDCYFMDPDKQCPYHNLTFPSGGSYEGRQVLEAYQQTFLHNAASILLVWGLGAHLKTLLGFWPHMTLQADKGAGKSTLIKRLERTLGFTMFSGQSLQTEFRLLTSISHTSHPVGWEELSARRQDVIDKAVAMLQENYQYTVSRRGADMTEYVLSAPVLLAGEDVPVRSLTGKIVRTDLTGKKGPLMPEELPRFPVRQWLEFLTTKTRYEINEIYKKARQYCLDHCRATKDDNGALRMAGNYAALMTAWRLLCEFVELPIETGGFVSDCLAEMNSHISETSADREPWVMILETVLAEIDSGNYRHPYVFDTISINPGEEPVPCLLIRTSHIMAHISHSPALREKWNALSVKSDRVFKRQCLQAGVIVKEDHEKVINTRRVCHMVAFGLEKLAEYGLYTSPPDNFNVQ
jgi:Peduoviridae DNA primase